MAHMGSLEFEAFPVEIRLKIYRELLIAEDEEMLDPTEMRGNPTGLHPQILACNRKIQDEAATVLYGENCFTWTVVGLYPLELWHGFETEKTVISRRYSRLITRMHISVSFRGDDGDISGPAIQKAHDQTLANMENVCEKLRLNDLKYLEVYYINSYTGGPCAAMLGGGNLLGNPYEGQTCLLPLLSVRATQFKINHHASPAFTARLKAKVEGPKDAVFLASRQRQMEEPESELDTMDEDDQYDKDDE